MNHNWALRFGTFFLIVFIVLMLWSNNVITPGGDDQNIPMMEMAPSSKLEGSERLIPWVQFKARFAPNKFYERPWAQRCLDNYIALIGNARDSQARAHLFMESMEEGIKAFWMTTAVYFEPALN